MTLVEWIIVGIVIALVLTVSAGILMTLIMWLENKFRDARTRKFEEFLLKDVMPEIKKTTLEVTEDAMELCFRKSEEMMRRINGEES